MLKVEASKKWNSRVEQATKKTLEYSGRRTFKIFFILGEYRGIQKKAILEYSRRRIIKIFFNDGEDRGIEKKATLESGRWIFKIFFIHGEDKANTNYSRVF